jgi:hypothetical protein
MPVQTRSGMLRADLLAAMRPPPDVWTDSGWAPAAVDLLGESPIMRVQLSDGSSLECAAGAAWPIVPQRGEASALHTRTAPQLNAAESAPQDRLLDFREGPPGLRRANTAMASMMSAASMDAVAPPLWAPKLTSELVPGDRIAPYPALPVVELASSGLSVADARALGATVGKEAMASSVRVQALSAHPHRAGLSNDEARAFVEGWASAQNGCLIGCETLIVELQALLRRAGVNRTLLERHPRQAASLYVDDREAWAATTRRLWTRRLRTATQTVIAVEILKSRGPVYRIATPIPAAIAIGNTTLATVASVC